MSCAESSAFIIGNEEEVKIDFYFCRVNRLYQAERRYFVSQKGSHIKLAKKVSGREITTVVPQHKELAHGTLKGALELAQVDEKEFWEKA